MSKTPLTISYWPDKKLMTVSGKSLRVAAEGKLAAGRYNIGTPKAAPGGGKIATAKIPASSMIHGAVDECCTVYGGGGRADTVYGGGGQADTVYGGGFRADTVYGGGRFNTITSSRVSTIYAGRGPAHGGLIDLYFVPYVQRNRYQQYPTILLKSGGDDLLKLLESAGGALLAVYY